MKFGYLHPNNAEGIHPGELAKELEQRGFESLWLPEHSHLPVASVGDFPDPAHAIPDGYAHMMNPFISLMAAAATTTTLTLATGMSVGLEHDLLDLACTSATLDRLSQSRFILGLGAGWNAEELHNHWPELPFKQRYSALKERVAALRAAWTHENCLPSYDGLYADTDWGRSISSYSGKYESFSPSWVFPKPAGGSIPVALGLAGALGTKHAAEYGDIWAPVDFALRSADGKSEVARRIDSFYQQVEEAGRTRDDVSITLFNITGVTDQMIEKYASLDIERFVFGPETFMRHSATETLRYLDSLQKYIDLYRS